jgi:lipid-binding SYLF domain-containing protein
MASENEKESQAEREGTAATSAATTAFAVAAGFFAGLVWIGSKLGSDLNASKSPERTRTDSGWHA